MAKEIERKFLIKVNDFKNLAKNHEVITILQGYLILKDKFHTRVRVSTIKNKSTATLASKVGSGMVRDEFEENISLEHGNLLLKKSIRLLRKKRIKVKYKGLIWDVDFFPDYNLAVAEVEIPEEEYKFEKPSWVGPEVTGNSKYSNIRMAKKKSK